MGAHEFARIKAQMDYEGARSGPPDGFPRLPVIPPGRYTDPAFYDLELKYVWKRTWVYAIHGDEVPERGSYRLWDLLGEPLIFVRGNDDVVRCFYNTCRHRGAPVATEQSGTTRGLVCGYHGWTYNLTGDLVSLRDKRDFVGLDVSCHSLIPVRCESIGRYVFINMDPDAGSLEDYLGAVGDTLRQQQPDRLRLVSKKTYPVKSNVKVLIEAFLEVYHLKSIHAQTVDRFLDHRLAVATMWEKGHSRLATPMRKVGAVDPGTIGLPKMETADELMKSATSQTLLYPNTAIAWSEFGSPAMIFWPTGVNTSICEVHWFAPSWGDGPRPPAWDARLRNFERVLMEDVQFQEGIQRSLESDGYKGSTLNYQERRIYQWHEEADRLIGEHVPKHLHVKPMLDRFIEPRPEADGASRAAGMLG